MYTLSYRKIALELAALNLLVLTCSSRLSFPVLCGVVASLNVGTLLAFGLVRRVYRVQVQPQALVLYTFRFGRHRKEHRVPYADLEVTYRKELAGKGIFQRRIRVYEQGTLRAILAPSLSGWQHDTLDEIVSDLKQHQVVVQTDEA